MIGTNTLSNIGSKIYSVCEAFVKPDYEYVPAFFILKACNKKNHKNTYTHLFRCMDTLSIPVTSHEIGNMLVFDYLINNCDRHYGNFGFIRDVNTNIFLGMAPLFDHGNSCWYNDDTALMMHNQESKPFKDNHELQISLVKETTLGLSQLNKDTILRYSHVAYGNSATITDERRAKICTRVSANLSFLLRHFGA